MTTDSTEELEKYIAILIDGTDENAFVAADRLAYMDTVEVVERLIPLISNENPDTVYLAARALSKTKENALALPAMIEELRKAELDDFKKGALTEALSEFDCSEYFVDVLKLYLFGSFKVSAMAKIVLDEQEFAITPRVIKKAEKHWNHYVHNIKQDEAFEVKKEEIESMFAIMKELFEGEEDLEETEDSEN